MGEVWENPSDASELSSALLSSDSAQAGGLSARFGLAREIFGPARLEKIELMRAGFYRYHRGQV